MNKIGCGIVVNHSKVGERESGHNGGFLSQSPANTSLHQLFVHVVSKLPPLSPPPLFHQPLVTTLKEMVSEVRESIAEKKSELENLPLETGRIDLISYASCPPCQYALIFPSQRIKNAWEQDFLLAKTKADELAPPTTNVSPPTSPPPVSTSVSQALEFIHPILLQSGGVGTKVPQEVPYFLCIMYDCTTSFLDHVCYCGSSSWLCFLWLPVVVL